MKQLLWALVIGVCPKMAWGAVSLKEAYEQALQKNETVAVSQSETRQADERVAQGVGRVLPTVSLIGNYLRQDQGGGASSAFTRADQGTLRANLTQPIFRGFGEWSELNSRRALLRAQEQNEKGVRLTLMGNVAEAYYSVLQAESDRKDLEEQLDLTQKRVDELKGRVRIGRSRQGELLTAEAQRATLLAQKEQAELAVQTSRKNLAVVTRVAEETELVDVPPAAVAPEVMPLAEALAYVEKRPDILAAKERVDSADSQVSVASSQHFPTLDFAANYYFKRTGILENSKWDLGLQFTLPLFQGGTVMAQTREASERRKGQELQLAALREDARRQITNGHATYVRSVSQLKAFDEAVRLSELNYKEQIKDFRNGLVDHLDVLTSLNSLEEVKRSRNRLRYQTEITRYRFQAAIGQEKI